MSHMATLVQKAKLTNDPAAVTTALKFTEQAVRIGGEVLEVENVRGQALLFLRKYDEAIESFIKARDQQPSNLLTLTGLATTYQQKALYGVQVSPPQRDDFLRKAQETFQSAVLFWPLYWGARNELGGFYFDQGQYNQARKEWERAIELNPNSTWGHINLGNVYIKLGQNAEAEKSFRRAFDQLTENQQTKEEAYLGWGTAIYYLGRFPEAAQIFVMGREQYPQSYLLQINLGDALRQMTGREKEARMAYQKAIELLEKTQRDEGATGWAHLAEVYAKRSKIQAAQDSPPTNDSQQALRFIRLALANAPQEADVLASATLVYQLTGDTSQALEYCRQALMQGYGLADVEHEPDLLELRFDKRYEDMKRKFPKPS